MAFHSSMRERHCISNICMKLWFERRDVNVDGRASRFDAARETGLRMDGGGRRVATNQSYSSNEVRHGLHDVGTPARMAWPGAVIHEKPRPPRRADLPQAGRGGSALEGDSDRGGTQEKGTSRRPVEHVPAAVLARG